MASVGIKPTAAQNSRKRQPDGPLNTFCHGPFQNYNFGSPSGGIEIPNEVMADVFVLCDLPTRCKLRRVCPYWKWLISSNQINQVVLINWRCTYVKNPQYRGSARIHPCPGSKLHSVTDKFQFGWYDVGMPEATTVNPWPDSLRRHRPCITTTANVCLEDHRRQGLLGPHVKTLIYDCQYNDDSAWAPSRSSDIATVRAIRSIGYYCSGVQHVIMWHYGLPHMCSSWLWCPIVRREHFWIDPPSHLPKPTLFTVVASQFSVADVGDGLRLDAAIFSMQGHLLRVQIRAWTDMTELEDITSYTGDFLPSAPEFRVWLSQNVRYLPKKYHDWARNGIEIELFDGPTTTIKLDLIDGDYMNICPFSGMPKSDLTQEHLAYEYFLGTLAKWIMEEKVAITDVPPHSPTDRLDLLLLSDNN